MGEPPTIDEKLISVSYYRMPLAAGQTGGAVPIAANALAAAQWNSHQQKFSEETERLAEYSASMYAKTAEEKAYYLDYYRNYYRNGGTSENAAPKPSSESMVIVNGVEYKRYRKYCNFVNTIRYILNIKILWFKVLHFIVFEAAFLI